MSGIYLALFEYDDTDSHLGIVFPDVPGCVSCGKDMEDAFRMAHEALSFHLDSMQEDGEQIPKPRTINEIMKKWPDWKEWEDNYKFFVVPITYIPARTRNKKFNIVMDEGLVNRIDRVSKNRSAFLSEAAKRYLKGN